jgi:BarA-like signal transduction histidine kinase
MSQKKSCRENHNTHFMFNNSFPPENRAVYEIMWTNMAESERPQMTIWRVRIACWVTKVTDTQSDYVILMGFPWQ